MCVLSQIHFLYLLKLVCFILSLGGIFALAQLTSEDLLSVLISDLVRILGSTKGWVSYFPFSGVSFDTSVYGFATFLSSLATYAICRDMFAPVTFRALASSFVSNLLRLPVAWLLFRLSYTLVRMESWRIRLP